MAKAKKEMMMRMEEEKKKNTPLDEFEKERMEKSSAINSKAFEFTKEQLDDVKDMNKMVAYAKAVTIRDRQLNQKKEIWEEFKDQEKKKDLLMEVERLKKLRQYEEEDRARKQLAEKGREVIVEQIKEREIERLRIKEEQEREAILLLKAAE